MVDIDANVADVAVFAASVRGRRSGRFASLSPMMTRLVRQPCRLTLAVGSNAIGCPVHNRCGLYRWIG